MPALALKYLWKPIALIAIVAAMIAYRGILIHQRNIARAQVTALEGEVPGLRSSNAALQAAIAQQNAAVDALNQRLRESQAQAQQREQAFAEHASEIMQREYARANAMKNSEVPPGCDGAIKWGNAQGAELGKW